LFRIVGNFSTDISQRSVATRVRYGGIFDDDHHEFTAESVDERILKNV